MNTESSEKIPIFAIVGGLPGSGKTTFSEQLLTTRPGVFLCPDKYMAELNIDLKDQEKREIIERQLFDQAMQQLEMGENVILEFPCWYRAERDELRTRAKALGARVELYFLEPDINEIHSRLQKRNQINDKTLGHISKEELNSWANKVESPTTEELQLYDNYR
jgi:predicted kinase